MRLPRWLSATALVVVAFALIAVLLASVDLTVVLSLVMEASPLGFLGLVVFSLVSWALLPTWRWHAILAEMGYRLPAHRLALARMGAQPLKVLIPFRGGEAFRALWLRTVYSVPLLTGLASVLFDLFLVALAQALFLAIGIGLAGDRAGVQVIPALALVLVVFAFGARSLHVAALMLVASIRPAWAARLEPLVHGFLRFPMQEKLRLLGIALIVELSECVSLYACFRLMGADVPLSAVFTLIPFVVGATLLPVTIGGFGTRELAIVWLFSNYATQEALTGAALLFAAVEFVLPALIGLCVTGRFSREMNEEVPPSVPPI